MGLFSRKGENNYYQVRSMYVSRDTVRRMMSIHWKRSNLARTKARLVRVQTCVFVFLQHRSVPGTYLIFCHPLSPYYEAG